MSTTILFPLSISFLTLFYAMCGLLGMAIYFVASSSRGFALQAKPSVSEGHIVHVRGDAKPWLFNGEKRGGKVLVTPATPDCESVVQRCVSIKDLQVPPTERLDGAGNLSARAFIRDANLMTELESVQLQFFGEVLFEDPQDIEDDRTEEVFHTFIFDRYSPLADKHVHP